LAIESAAPNAHPPSRLIVNEDNPPLTAGKVTCAPEPPIVTFELVPPVNVPPVVVIGPFKFRLRAPIVYAPFDKVRVPFTVNVVTCCVEPPELLSVKLLSCVILDGTLLATVPLITND